MADIPDLWPNQLTDENITLTPLAIFKQQAAILGKKTAGLVEAKVSRWVDEEKDLMYTFKLIVPSLNYSYSLFTAWHKPIMQYPIKCLFGDPPSRECRDQEELMHWLKAVFGSPETKRILNGLMLQAKDGAADVQEV